MDKMDRYCDVMMCVMSSPYKGVTGKNGIIYDLIGVNWSTFLARDHIHSTESTLLEFEKLAA